MDAKCRTVKAIQTLVPDPTRWQSKADEIRSKTVQFPAVRLAVVRCIWKLPAMALNPQSRAVWSTAKVRVWPDLVVLATFPRFAGDRVAAFAGRVGVRDASAFVAFVTEGEECSLTAPAAAFGAWRLRDRATEVTTGLRALTIDASMPVDLVGFLAPLAERLAAAQIPIIPQCGFRTDHVLLPNARLDDAVKVIEGLIADARKEGP